MTQNDKEVASEGQVSAAYHMPAMPEALVTSNPFTDGTMKM